MSLLRQIVAHRASPENPSTNLADPAAWLVDWAGGGTTASGKAVSPDSAMQVSAVYACVRVLSESVASLPAITYRRLVPRGKERATSHPLYSLLHDAPNPSMTAFTFWETAVAHINLWGNFYAIIRRDGGGRVTELWPLPPWWVDPQKDERTGEVTYMIYGEGWMRRVPADDILHIPGLSFNGVRGYSPIHFARQTIGHMLASEEFGARFFGQGARPSGILTHPMSLDDAARKNIKDTIIAPLQGLGGAQKIALLEEGMKWESVGMPLEDAQFLETRKYGEVQICGIFRVPPHMIGNLERATFSNVEQQSIDFTTHGVRPWLVRIEQQAKRRLFGVEGDFFLEFLVDGLLRGETKARYESHAIAFRNGWMSRNEIREIENKNPIEDQGDKYFIDQTLLPADEPRAEEPAPEPAPKPNARAILSPIVTDALTRLNEKERKAVADGRKKCETKGIDYAGWIAAYYDDHAEGVRKALTPVFGAARSLGCSCPDLDFEIDTYTKAGKRFTEHTSEHALAARIENLLRSFGDV